MRTAGWKAVPASGRQRERRQRERERSCGRSKTRALTANRAVYVFGFPLSRCSLAFSNLPSLSLTGVTTVSTAFLSPLARRDPNEPEPLLAGGRYIGLGDDNDAVALVGDAAAAAAAGTALLVPFVVASFSLEEEEEEDADPRDRRPAAPPEALGASAREREGERTNQFECPSCWFRF